MELQLRVGEFLGIVGVFEAGGDIVAELALEGEDEAF